MHRDLKGENLLITDNERIKVCDFGFARIAARNEEEMRRISYCGTDGYMSPEILLGIDFSLPSDIFSLGVIFCEIASRHLVDSHVFKRQMPEFGLDESEVREMASDGCPQRFVQLALDCVQVDPANRPEMREVVRRLRDIEIEVIERAEKENRGSVKPVGSIRGSSVHAVVGSKGRKSKKGRPQAPRLPSFNGQIALPSHHEESDRRAQNSSGGSASESDEEDFDAALAQLEKVRVADPSGTVKEGELFKVSGHGNPWWSDDRSTLPSIRSSWLPSHDDSKTPPGSRPPVPSTLRDNKWASASTSTLGTPHAEQAASDSGTVLGDDVKYSTAVVKPSRIAGSGRGSAFRDSLSRLNVANGANKPAESEGADPVSSTLTVKTVQASERRESVPNATTLSSRPSPSESPRPQQGVEPSGPASYMTARSAFADGNDNGHAHDPSLAVATVASSIYSPAPLYHRFTLVKNGTRRPSLSKLRTAGGCDVRQQDAVVGSASRPSSAASMLPPALMLANALAKCHVCNKRIGWKPFLDCDDCPYKCHVGCGDLAEPTCQELAIPGDSHPPFISASVGARGSNVPIVTAFNADTRGVHSADSPCASQHASPKVGNQRFDSASPSPEREAKDKKGGAAARLKRWNNRAPPSVKA